MGNLYHSSVLKELFSRRPRCLIKVNFLFCIKLSEKNIFKFSEMNSYFVNCIAKFSGELALVLNDKITCLNQWHNIKITQECVKYTSP